jgi:hypothetical protein
MGGNIALSALLSLLLYIICCSGKDKIRKLNNSKVFGRIISWLSVNVVKFGTGYVPLITHNKATILMFFHLLKMLSK